MNRCPTLVPSRIALAAVAQFVFLACSPATTNSGHSRAFPIAACTLRRPRTEPASTVIGRGIVSFHRVCGGCHPGGDADIGPRLLDAGFAESHLRLQVRRGGGLMSGVPESCLSAHDLDDVVVYLRELHAVR